MGTLFAMLLSMTMMGGCAHTTNLMKDSPAIAPLADHAAKLRNKSTRQKKAKERPRHSKVDKRWIPERLPGAVYLNSPPGGRRGY